MFIEWTIKKHSMIITENNYHINIICIKLNYLKILYLSKTLLWHLQTFLTPIASVWNVSLSSALEEFLIIEPVLKMIVISKLSIEPSKHSSWWRRTEDVLNTSWTRLRCNIFLSSKTLSRHNCKTSSWRRLENVLGRCIANTSWRRLEDVFKTSWKIKHCQVEDIFKTSRKTKNVCWDASKKWWWFMFVVEQTFDH